MANKTKSNKTLLNMYFDNLNTTKKLSREEEIELTKRIKKGDKLAFNTMFKNNLKLVVKIAKFYATPEWQLEDLIQEGNIGLLKAIEKYDHTRNVKFSTYAAWWIKQAIFRSINNKKRIIRLPYRKEEKLKKISKFINKYSQEHNKMPSVEEIANTLNLSIKETKVLVNFTNNIISTDAEINDEGTSNIYNIIPDYSFSPDKVFMDKELLDQTNMILEKLKEKEKLIIKNRFGFLNNKKLTLKQIAKELNVSPETVRQIEMKTLSKIRNEFQYLKDYL